MFLSVEKELLANNYHSLVNYGDIASYHSSGDAKKQVEITFNNMMNNWAFSFPLKNSVFNYITHFKHPQELKQYALKQVCNL